MMKQNLAPIRRGRQLRRGLLASGLGFTLLTFLSAAVELPQGTTVAETYREAYDNGYRDGLRSGQSDRDSDGLFDLANKKQYQMADRGYESARHDREVYLVAYRRGFEDGYEEGYGVGVGRSKPQDLVAVTAPAAAADRPPDKRVISQRPTKIPAGIEFKIELLDTLNTKYNERGDPFRAQVFSDVRIGQQIVIPRGTQVTGSVAYLKRSGRIRGRAQLSLRFEELIFLDGRRVPLEARVVDIEEQSEEKLKDDEGKIVARSGTAGDAKSVGTASAIGALIGVITGGKKGAAVGAGTGAVAGLASVLVTRGRDAQLEARTQLTIQLTQEIELIASP